VTAIAGAAAVATVFASVKVYKDYRENSKPEGLPEDQSTEEDTLEAYEKDKSLDEARPILDPTLQDGRFPIDPEEQKETPGLDELNANKSSPTPKESKPSTAGESPKEGLRRKELQDNRQLVTDPQAKEKFRKAEGAEPSAVKQKTTPQDRYKFQDQNVPQPVVGKVAAQLGPLSAELVSKSKSGMRHKYKFTGFSGADTMSKYGSYTEDEAKTIVELKSKKVFTGALRGGLPPNVQAKIEVYAKKHGVSQEYMERVALMESGGNQNAISFTGAIGIYQFVGKTASNMGVKDRFDLDQNIEGGALLAKENVRYLPAAYQNDPVALYLVHQLGPSAAREVLLNAGRPGAKISDLTPGTVDALSKNFGGKSTYVAEYMAVTRNKLAFSNDTERTNYASAKPSKPKTSAAPNTVASTQHTPSSKPQEFAKIGNTVVAL
jgi:hypothetical protein